MGRYLYLNARICLEFWLPVSSRLPHRRNVEKIPVLMHQKNYTFRSLLDGGKGSFLNGNPP
jgi:hypothetical protein